MDERYPYDLIRSEACLASATPDAAIAAVLYQPAASAQLSFDFLGFMDIYAAASRVLPRRTRIVDIGASTAIQSWYFADFAAYTAVEPPSLGDWSLSPGLIPTNARAVRLRAQEFFETESLDEGRDFLICSAVPDDEVLPALQASGCPFIWWYPGQPVRFAGASGAAVAAALDASFPAQSFLEGDRQAALEKVEDAVDLKAYDDALAEDDGVTYSMQEAMRIAMMSD